METFKINIYPMSNGMGFTYVIEKMMEYDPYDVFDISNDSTVTAQDLASEHLAELCFSVEITINIPPKVQAKLTLVEQISMYRNLFESLKLEYNAPRGTNTIEYCKSGYPHLHGWIDIKLPANVYQYDDREILRMIAKSIYLKLPKCLYKQFANAIIDGNFRRLKTPLLCLNLKNVLSQEWVNYIQKNA